MTAATTASTTFPTTIVHPESGSEEWWREAVIYQVYPRSFADADGDGIGDLPGITSRLPYLRDLGVDAVWMSPFYVSPMADAGYDVADYRDIDPVFGSLADADALVAKAHELGIKVIIDLVPNHSSDEHVWFQEALASPPGSAARERYMFHDGRGPHGDELPNNWQSCFGGPAWTRTTNPDGSPGQWYLNFFDSKQPDFNWENREVWDEFESILRFWLDRGVDGFRVDVAHGLVKEPGLPDVKTEEGPELLYSNLRDLRELPADRPNSPMWDQDGVHDIYRAWRSVLDEYGTPDRILCAEGWVEPPARLVRYTRPDEMHQAFNFDFLECPWRATDFTQTIIDSLKTADSVGAPTTWVLSNHDVVRHATRLALPIGEHRPNGIGANDPQPDAELGLRRARAATTLMLGLPGAAYLYQGEELGLPESTDMPDEYRQDPAYHRTKGTPEAQLGRDGCRVPIPWDAEAPSLGFGPSDKTWLPQPASYAAHALSVQEGVAGSTVELYRSLLTLRKTLRLGHGALASVAGFGPDVVALSNDAKGRERVLLLANLGIEPVAIT